MHMYVPIPKAINNLWHDMDPILLVKQFLQPYMAITVGIMAFASCTNQLDKSKLVMHKPLL